MTEDRKNKIERVLSKRQNDLTIILENVFDPHNISAVMRSCDSVGIQEIYVLNTKIPRHKKWGSRSSSSADKWLTIHQFDDLQLCLEAVRKKYDLILSTHLSVDAQLLYETDLTRSVALAFGNEHSGLSNEFLEFSNGNIIVPQVGMIQSLNISVACAVCLYEAYRQKNEALHYNNQKLPSEAFTRLKTQWSLNNERDK